MRSLADRPPHQPQAPTPLLLRQAYKRRDFSARVRAIEVCLRQDYPGILPLDSGPLYWFKSVSLGWTIFAESIFGFLAFLLLVFFGRP
jgi:hypothetical protein